MHFRDEGGQLARLAVKMPEGISVLILPAGPDDASGAPPGIHFKLAPMGPKDHRMVDGVTAMCYGRPRRTAHGRFCLTAVPRQKNCCKVVLWAGNEPEWDEAFGRTLRIRLHFLQTFSLIWSLFDDRLSGYLEGSNRAVL